MRLTFHMNKRLDRSGTLWKGRFKSVLVEDHERALLTIAAYIDLNPVRAGLVAIRRTTAGAAMPRRSRAGGEASGARDGLGRMLGEALDDPEYPKDWRRTAARYRMFLYQEGREVVADPESGQRGRRGFKEAEIEAVVERDGAMSLSEALRHRVRYFSDGAVLGSAEFVNAVFARETRSGRAIRRKAHERGSAHARGGLGRVARAARPAQGGRGKLGRSLPTAAAEHHGRRAPSPSPIPSRLRRFREGLCDRRLALRFVPTLQFVSRAIRRRDHAMGHDRFRSESVLA